MINQNDGWDRLACPYFHGCVREVFDSAAATAGYRLSSQRKEHDLSYLGPEGVVVRLGYLPETSPSYELRCVIELSVTESSAERDFFPLWFLEKRGIVKSALPFEFSSEDELRKALDLLKQVLFGPSVGIAFCERNQLVEWLREFSVYWASGREA